VVILVEGITAGAVEAAAEPELGIHALQSHGAAHDIQCGIYRLETSRVKTAFSAR
jgi:hypothetical protein